MADQYDPQRDTRSVDNKRLGYSGWRERICKGNEIDEKLLSNLT